jgi:hypothetical protein
MTPTPATAVWAINAPTVDIGGIDLTPSPASAAWGVVTPSIEIINTVTPDAVVATFGVVVPVVTYTGGAPTYYYSVARRMRLYWRR